MIAERVGKMVRGFEMLYGSKSDTPAKWGRECHRLVGVHVDKILEQLEHTIHHFALRNSWLESGVVKPFRPKAKRDDPITENECVRISHLIHDAPLIPGLRVSRGAGMNVQRARRDAVGLVFDMIPPKERVSCRLTAHLLGMHRASLYYLLNRWNAQDQSYRDGMVEKVRAALPAFRGFDA